MSTIIFDGKQFAATKEAQLAKQIATLGTSPKLVSIVIGDEDGALAYQRLKQKAAERVGCTLEIVHLPNESSSEQVIAVINEANTDSSVNGVMVQLPLPQTLKMDQAEILSKIAPGKDVDGMRNDSPFVAPVVRAVEDALSESGVATKNTIAVLGASGFVGDKLANRLTALGFKPKGYEIDSDLSEVRGFDIVVSATGQPGSVKSEMVKDGVVLIDVGAPQGDVAKEALAKARFATPVPGGIGPVTIYYLVENLVEATVESASVN